MIILYILLAHLVIVSIGFMFTSAKDYKYLFDRFIARMKWKKELRKRGK